MFLIIKSLNLNHSGGFYPYTVHFNKTDKLCNGLTPLQRYLKDMFTSCPNQFFNGGPRSSALKFKVPFDMIEVQGHEVSQLAKLGLEENSKRYSSNHLKVQYFMLENDDKTVAIEIPLWSQHDEIPDFVNIFNTIQPLTGHIDVLRVENDNVWVWDYKPNALKEKYASTQVYFYALMLSNRTRIPLDKMRCGYFDSNYAFMFKPRAIKLETNAKLI
ncbi:MAG TPA: PD-(D/E)XK nuclease family protein [Candidatus Nanoarchaeia archaeon]|nr:PD-(D/E)XK nuclease family protein [Candidatus Nanoarchaeia archaeon]